MNREKNPIGARCAAKAAPPLDASERGRLMRIGIVQMKAAADREAFLFQCLRYGHARQLLHIVVLAQMGQINSLRPVADHIGQRQARLLVRNVADIA